MLQKLFKKDENKSRGFTLIEVVIVLAIAGLIFVIVFVAVSAAQRARADNARQEASNRLLAAAEQFAGNNNGRYPANGWNGAQYFNDQGNPGNPATGTWTFGATPAVGRLAFNTGQVCPGGVANPRSVRVQTTLENGAPYCVDNS